MFREILINPATIVEFLCFNFIVRVLRKYVTNNQVYESFLHILMGRVMKLWGGDTYQWNERRQPPVVNGFIESSIDIYIEY